MSTRMTLGASLRLLNSAKAAHAHLPQYEGHWDEYRACTVTTDITTKLGLAFAKGDASIFVPEKTTNPLSVEYVTAYSARTGCDTRILRSQIITTRCGFGPGAVSASSSKTRTEDLVKAIQALEPAYKSFHLSPCGGCGAPSWQQPCPSCGFYPMGGRGAEANQCTDATRAKWCEHVRRVGGILAWYQNHSICRVVPAGRDFHKSAKIQAGLNGSDRLAEPSPEVIWDDVEAAEVTRLRDCYSEARRQAIFFGFKAKGFAVACDAVRVDAEGTVAEARSWVGAASRLAERAYNARNGADRSFDRMAPIWALADRNEAFKAEAFTTEAAWLGAAEAFLAAKPAAE